MLKQADKQHALEKLEDLRVKLENDEVEGIMLVVISDQLAINRWAFDVTTEMALFGMATTLFIHGNSIMAYQALQKE